MSFTPGDTRRFCGPPGATSYTNYVQKLAGSEKGAKARKKTKKSAASNEKLKHRELCKL